MKKFLYLLLILPLLTPLFAVQAEEAATRPNILFAFADDWGKHASAYAKVDGPGGANDVIQTPHFDRIASEGVLFKNAYVNAPSCTPCRSSLLSGQHFWRMKRASILQGAVWDSATPAWPLLLRDSGYHIGKSYKVWSPGTPRDAPYGEQEYAYRQGGSRVNSFSQTVTKLMANGKSAEDAKKEVLDEVRANFRQFLEDQEEGKPFCFWYGPTNVHRKWIKGSGKAIWGIEPDSLKGKLPAFLPDVHAIREDLADYLGEAQAFDAALGVLFEELEKSGQYDNTIIAISGDHGPAGFPHGKCNLYEFGTHVALAVSGPKIPGGRVVDDFAGIPDLAPTFLEAGNVEIPDVMTAKSLWPTLKSESEGLVDKSRTYVFTGRERHVATARPDYLPYPQRAIRTKDHLFIINFEPDRYPLGDPYSLDSDTPPTEEELTEETFVTLADEDAGPTKAWMVLHRDDPKWKDAFEHAYGKRPREQLFDLKKDPFEMNNVADNPEYAGVLAEIRGQLMSELETTVDPRLINGGEFFETPPMARERPEGVRDQQVKIMEKWGKKE